MYTFISINTNVLEGNTELMKSYQVIRHSRQSLSLFNLTTSENQTVLIFVYVTLSDVRTCSGPVGGAAWGGKGEGESIHHFP